MNHEQDHERDQAHATEAKNSDKSVPGRRSTSAALEGPEHPVASGILMRKARDDNGVAEGADEAVAAASSSSGSALPETLQGKFEESLGVDLSEVRVHTGGASEASASAVGAKAYTVGQDIHFGAGHFDPSSQAGEHLLAHEVAHTVQQRGAIPTRQNKLEVSTPGDYAEVEADRAADAMISGRSAQISSASGGVTSRAVIRRVLDDSQKKKWDEEKGDALVQQLKAEVGAWKAFRKNPTSHDAMPGSGVKGIADQIETLFGQDPAFRAHFNEQLGKESAPYLREMVSINHRACIKLESLGLASYVDPVHRWSMKVNANGDVAAVGGYLPITTLLITYTNSLGWNYSKPLAGAVVGFAATIGKEAGKSAKGGMKVGPTKISVNGTAEATNVAFWGTENLPGPVLVVNGPSGSGKVPGLGGKFNTGGMINLVGSGAPNSPLSFKDFEGSASVTPTKMPKSAKEAKEAVTPSASLTIVSGGAGYLGSDPSQETLVGTPEPVPELVEMTQQWDAQIAGFETGEDSMPQDEINGPLQSMKGRIDQHQKLVEANKSILMDEFNIKQDFKLQFTINGSASRIWGNAGNDAERKRLNQELSTRRAQNVASGCHAMFGPDHSYDFFGVGGGVDLGGGVVAPEAGNEAALEKLKAKRLAEARQQFPTMSEAELKKHVEENIGKTSNQQGARRVEVKVVWVGYGIKWGVNASAMPRNPNARPGGGGGGPGNGGQQGAGPTGDGGGGQGGAHG